MLCDVILIGVLCIVTDDYLNAHCLYAECHFAECHYSKCECQHSECCADCRYAN